VRTSLKTGFVWEKCPAGYSASTVGTDTTVIGLPRKVEPQKECGFKKEKKRGFSAVRLHAELLNALLAIRAREWKAVLRLVRSDVLTDPGQIIPSVPHALLS
jgi:hypothetical protein